MRYVKVFALLAAVGTVPAAVGAVMTIRYEAAVRQVMTYNDLYALDLRWTSRLPLAAYLAWLGVVAASSALSGVVLPAVRRERMSRRWTTAALVPGLNVAVAMVLLVRSARPRVAVVIWAVFAVATTVHVARWWTDQRLPGPGQGPMVMVNGADRVDERVRDAALLYQVAFPVRGWAVCC